ncbi:ERF family protein (plasmid) [Clostridium estertheticum]|uniref:ERF family protein n=1 Tax=Clostridium estertheticum TaxID=238834 RepID=UPI001C7D0841|nr:ERF family protein [Clostridium estertheticum]MBX4259785.1 ERF family protein [Clostridium estertheticum]WLC73277.1 ERF family protein [Clostridium estertheticum]
MDKLNIFQKIVEVRKSITGFSKDTKSFGFDYVSGSQILSKIKAKMDEMQLLLIPSVDYSTVHWEKHNYVTAKGKESMDFIVTFKLTYTWINAEIPTETLVTEWLALGQQTDDISKAVGTALTYNERYYLLKILGLPTDEDDADSKEPTGGKKSEFTSNNITTKMLIDMAKEKGIAETEICKQYGASEIKYIKQDDKKKAYEELKKMGEEENKTIDHNKVEAIEVLAKKKGIIMVSICAAYNITKFEQMTFPVWREATEKLESRPDKKIVNKDEKAENILGGF